MHRDARSIAPSYNRLFKMVNHLRELKNINVFRINNSKKKIVISVIHRCYRHFKIRNKNSRVCTLVKFYVFFCTIFCWSRHKMKNILHVQHTLRNSTLYGQVVALETETIEENHAIKKQYPTWTTTKNYSSLRRC